MAAMLPAHHLRPAYGWLNDPNGITYRDGRWHAFYQHNPHAPRHNRIAWGHASSVDLVTWTDHGVAFAPTSEGPDRFGCFSGVFVTGLDRPAVAYSGVIDPTLHSTICLRYGSADLTAWGEPIVVGTTPEHVTVMRDPFLFAWGGRRWALLGARIGAATPAVLLYDVSDVEDWRFVRAWLTGDDPLKHGDGGAATLADAAPADIWECPQLVAFGDEAVLVLSTQTAAILDTVVALTGRLTDHGDGTPAFTATGSSRLDDGALFYAPQAVADLDGRGPLLIGWLRQNDLPGAEPTRDVISCLSAPRRLSLSGGRLVQRIDPGWAAACGPGIPTSGPVTAGEPCRVHAQGTGSLTVRSGIVEHHVAVEGGVSVWIDGEIIEVFADAERVPWSMRAPLDERGRAVEPWTVSAPEATLTVSPLLG